MLIMFKSEWTRSKKKIEDDDDIEDDDMIYDEDTDNIISEVISQIFDDADLTKEYLDLSDSVLQNLL